MTSPILEVRSLCKSHGEGRIEAPRGVDLSVEAGEFAEALLREMCLEDRMRQHPNQLSAGEQQRVAIARAKANVPFILLADEPTGNLDSTNSEHIMDILTHIQKKRGMPLIVITHEDEIANAAPRHIRIRDGTIVQ
jgi:putative ABC transport system ATP-binding protein